jgi:diacylglycerol kinase family enzyme
LVDDLLSLSPRAATPSFPTSEVPFAVDGHRAFVTLGSDELQINYKPSRNCCCIPTQKFEVIPFSEILSAQPLPPVTTKWLWHPFPETTYRISIHTFRRSIRNPSHWIPRNIIVATTAEGVAQRWAAVINSAAASQLHRPRHLLVLINPFGGKKQGVDVYNKHVAPVFDHAGIKSTVIQTQFCGHARTLILDMSSSELSSYDGVVAVGGDGLFHEIVNGLLSLRSMAVKRTTTESGGDSISMLLNSIQSGSNVGDNGGNGANNGEQQLDNTTNINSTNSTAGNNNTASTNSINSEILRKAQIAFSLRVGHIPAGSTDAVACTLNGTRNAFSAAMRIALGDKVPLDVLRIDAADGTTEFATCMASYGFMGDLMSESESLRWIGPLRYELVGAKMLAANRSYRAKISYLPAEAVHAGSFSKVCSANCEICYGRPERNKSLMNGSKSSGNLINLNLNYRSNSPKNGVGPSYYTSGSHNSQHNGSNNTKDSLLGGGIGGVSSSNGGGGGSNINNGSGGGGGRASPSTPSPSPSPPPPPRPTSPTNHNTSRHSPFARHSRMSLNHRQRDWKTVEDDFAGVMLVIMPCRSDKSAAGVARYGHLSDGNIHLVLVRRCSRLQYLRFLLTMSSTGLEPGRHLGGYVEVIPAVAVRVEPGGSQESQWNIDGELLNCAAITAETHRGAIEVFARGVESY